MANAGLPDTGGSQFFIVVHDPKTKKEPAGLDPFYTIFGHTTEASDETLQKIATRPVKGGDDPATIDEPKVPVFIEKLRITEG
jgi:cyclophilin family peptidyl-prolyl cis-trans isomerase